MQAINEALVEDTEIRLLLDGIVNCYGFDFRDYATEPLKRCIWERVHAEGAQTISGYQEKILHEPACMEQLLRALHSDNIGMFQDPVLWREFRAIVVPRLRTYPSIQLWVPGCSGGEEAYALAILLHEEGLLPRSRIYATDLSAVILRNAREGTYPLSRMYEYAEQYAEAGGTWAFTSYYTVDQQHAIMAPFLKEHIVFAEHNLATDGPFNEFQAILCRHAVAAFNEWLQERVHGLFLQSLSRFGILALGPHEFPKVLSGAPRYAALPGGTLYRKDN